MKWGGTEKMGGKKTFLKGGGGKLVDGVGALKKGGLEPPHELQSWELKIVLESPGILLKFWKSPGNILEFFCGQTVQKRDF